VLDVLLLLPVARGLLEGLDDEGRGGWDNRDRGLTVLDGKTDGDTESFLLRRTQLVPLLPLFVGFVGLHTQSPVAFAISSPTFLGERPRGPILGASADDAPTSPPVARRWLCGD